MLTRSGLTRHIGNGHHCHVPLALDNHMKRLAVIGSLLVGAVTLAACGSSTAPKPTTFAGSWVGYVLADTANITATQSGNAFTGSGTLFANGDSAGLTFN